MGWSALVYANPLRLITWSLPAIGSFPTMQTLSTQGERAAESERLRGRSGRLHRSYRA